MKRYRDGRVYGAPTGQRLLAHAVDGPGGCWLWDGSKAPGGYGKTRIGGKYAAVHRAAFEAFVGPIPTGATVDHTCFTPACFNPAHLRLLSWSENTQRQRTKLATHCQRGHQFSPSNTWTYPRGGPCGTWRRTCKTCQRERIAERRQLRAAS